jgi:hypothetical protein
MSVEITMETEDDCAVDVEQLAGSRLGDDRMASRCPNRRDNPVIVY